MKAVTFSIAIIIALVPVSLFAAIPVGVLPFEGDATPAKQFEDRVKQVLTEDGVLGIVDDSMMKKIIEIHEKAMTFGSTMHDISKLKAAQFLIKGSVRGATAQLIVIDVNGGTEIFNSSADYNKRNEYRIKKMISEAKELIAVKAYQASDLPAEAKPYMNLVLKFVESLELADTASYPYLGVCQGGACKHPVSTDKDLADKANAVVKVVRPLLVRSKIIFNGIDTKAGSIIYLRVIAEKFGKKSKHKFGIMEMSDGSLGITNYFLE